MSQFIRFCIVGTVGFVVDAGVLLGLVAAFDADPYAGRVVSFLAAATATWWLNRHYTFAVRHPASRHEWVRYTALMVLGALANYGVYAGLITLWEVFRENLWLAVGIGSIAGLGINFATSRRFVFGPGRLTP